MAFITLQIQNKEISRHPLDKNKVIKIGRLKENDIVIDNLAVSGRHAEILWEERGFIINDIGSRNSTFIAGNPIKSRRLAEGDVITVGKHELLFSEQELQYSSTDSEQEKSFNFHSKSHDPTSFLDTRQQRNILEQYDRMGYKKPLLVVKYKDKMLYKFLLKFKNTSIGRNPNNNIAIDNTAVSSEHAVITSDGSKFTIKDLGSKNGIFVNKELVKTCKLFNGDIITIGKHEIVFEEVGTYTYDEVAKPLVESQLMLSTDGTTCLKTKKHQEMISDISDKKSKAGFTFLKGGRGYVSINSKTFKIGKCKSSDIIVKGLMVGDTAALITSIENHYYLTYQKGITKPVVNGNMIKGSVKLKNADIIKIGTTELKFNS
jgi:pSer/pThr/pTyr-binding forkhead associated (FHA) protein